MTTNYFHLDQVDHPELMYLLLNHFNQCVNTQVYTYRYQKAGTDYFLEIRTNTNGQIQQVIPSKQFPAEELNIINQKIQETLISDHGTKIGKTVAFCNEKVEGYFRYKGLFQMLSLPSDAPQANVAVADHPFLLEFTYQSCPNITIDNIRKMKKAVIFTRLLNLLMNQAISLGSRYTQFGWVTKTDDPTNFTCEWKQLGYMHGSIGGGNDYSSVDNLTEIERVPISEYYSVRGRSSYAVKIPNNLEQSLDTAFALDETTWNRFFMACSWYSQYQFTWQESHSSAFIALVTALECLINEHEKCQCCNQVLQDGIDTCECCRQPKYRLTRRFQNFLRQYFPIIDQFPNEKRTIYQVRSQLAHGIDLLYADLEPWNFMMGTKNDEQRQLQYNLYLIVKVAMYNWLQSH